MPDKYTAVWVSHTSISDFLQCPRAYYLKNIYRDPNTNHKVQLMSPPLALGGAVHEVLESLSQIPTKERFKKSLLESFAEAWKKIAGKRGGFVDDSTENLYRQRGEEMLRRVQTNPGILNNLSVKIKEDLPHYWLSAEDNIILCGKVDWLEYLPDSDSVHIVDFKTGKQEERTDSLQLPIYHLLVHNTQKRAVSKASYWYLTLDDEPTEKELPDLTQAHQDIVTIAKKIKTARALKVFKCPQGSEGCFACKPMERVVRGEAELVGENSYGQDIYILNVANTNEINDESMIL